MRMKRTSLLFLVTLLVLLPLITTKTNATVYPVRVIQDPQVVYAYDSVTITVEIDDMIRDEEILIAELTFRLDGLTQPVVLPEQNIPTRLSIITFEIGSFIEGDKIDYKIYLKYYTTTVLDYNSGWFSFTVRSGSRPLAISQVWSIAVASVVTVLAIVVIVWKLRKKR